MRNNTKTKKANRRLQRKLSKTIRELEFLRTILVPFHYFKNGNYNRWRKYTPGHININEASELLKEYFRENPTEEMLHHNVQIILERAGFERVSAKDWLTLDRMADAAKEAAKTEELLPVGRVPK